MPTLAALPALLLAMTTLAAAPSSREQVARSEQWLRLLHYSNKLFAGRTSTEDGDSFFLSPAGKSDPLAELEADVAAFAQSAALGDRHPQCQFPARFRFLREALALETRAVPCPALEKWRSELAAESATLVFSSPTSVNPDSMFGHLFLKLNARPDAKSGRRNDTGIGYGADADEANPGFILTHGFKGMTGGYYGRLTIEPYPKSVHNYTEAESRDLWEYDLQLTPAQLALLTLHVWELDHRARFSYYFFDQNCAYMVLTLLEAANPEWRLTDRFFLYLYPADGVKALLSHAGAVGAIRFRPSNRKILAAERAELSGAQQDEFRGVVDRREKIDQVRDRAVLEALDAYFTYQRYNNHGADAEDTEDLYRNVQEYRKAVPAALRRRNRPVAAQLTRPDLGHYTSLAGVRFGAHRAGERFVGLSYRLGLHDLLNDDVGYDPYTQLDFVRVSADYLIASHKLKLAELSLAELTYLFPFDRLDPEPSWKLAIRYTRLTDTPCDYCHGFSLEGGAGLATEPVTQALLLYALGLVNIEASPHLPKTARLGPAAQAGLIASPVSGWKIHLSAQAHYEVLRSYRSAHYFRYEAGQAVALSQSADLRLTGELVPRAARGEPDYFEAMVHANYFF